MTASYRSQIPERVVEIAKRCLPPEADNDDFWKRVDAEIVPDYREAISLPIYEEWLTLQLSHLWAKAQDALTTEASHPCTFRLQALLDALPKPPIAPDGSPKTDAQVEFLRRQLEDRGREWMTDRVAPRLGRPNQKFIDEVVRRAREIPEYLIDADSPYRGDDVPPAPELFDRIPSALISHIMRAFPRQSRSPRFWNPIREFVYPHFDEKLLPREPYRRYLNLLVRFHALHEPPETLLPEIEVLTQFFRLPMAELMSPYVEGPLAADSERIGEKVNDLHQTIKTAKGRER